MTIEAQQYFQRLQQFELEPGMINLQLAEASQVWIGANIDRLNAILYQHLIACQDCFFPQNRVPVLVLAAPINPDFKIDGFCNVRVDPATIVIDVGRVVSEDWLKVVAHEYAHAIVGGSGHSPQFSNVLQHLCLGLGFDFLPIEKRQETDLQVFPAYRSTIDSRLFWHGKTVGSMYAGDCQKMQAKSESM